MDFDGQSDRQLQKRKCHMDNLNQSSTGPQGQSSSPKLRWTSLIWLLLVLLALSWFLPSLLGQSGSPGNETVTYSTFLAQGNAHNVQSVPLTDFTVTGR